MTIPYTLLLAVGLAMDACAVAAGASASGRSRGHRAAFRLSFHFGLFQFLMPVVGWFTGGAVATHMAALDHWIAFAILAFIGGRMIRSGRDPDSGEQRIDPSRGWSLVLLSIATSIDALAVGFGLALIDVNIWIPAAVIGLLTAGLTLVALQMGSRLGRRFGPRMEIIGGGVLIFVGLHILIDHLGA